MPTKLKLYLHVATKFGPPWETKSFPATHNVGKLSGWACKEPDWGSIRQGHRPQQEQRPGGGGGGEWPVRVRATRHRPATKGSCLARTSTSATCLAQGSTFWLVALSADWPPFPWNLGNLSTSSVRSRWPVSCTVAWTPRVASIKSVSGGLYSHVQGEISSFSFIDHFRCNTGGQIMLGHCQILPRKCQQPQPSDGGDLRHKDQSFVKRPSH